MQKIKLFLQSENGKTILIIIITILVSLASFGLGRLSKSTEGGGIRVEYLPETGQNQGAGAILASNPLETENPSIKTFFASNRGSKYYHPGCSGGKEIKEENRVYFATESEAVSAGYEKSTSCR